MTEQNGISEKSRRVAKNTLLLYLRMLLLMFVGLFTSRIVLQTLGVEDYGTYQVVYSTVMMFSILSNGIGSSIGRFMAFELGTGDVSGMRKVFSSAAVIQIGLCIILFILAETLGLWYLKNKTVIPDGRENAAMWAFQASVIIMAIQLMSLPFNCTIVAHEDMKAYAWVSIVEGCLKLILALTLYLTSFDKLKVYSVLMVTVALIIRGIYAVFCKRHYVETRGRLQPDKSITRQMLSLGAWSFTAHGVAVFNTQGVNLLSNAYFGVGINAIRGIAGQVENIVRQLVTNFLTALNPLIIKTWAGGDKDYCFELVCKGCKFAYLIVLIFAVPFLFESDFILRVWLGNVPDGSSLFVRLAIICVMIDFMSNSLGQLMLANGQVAKYYGVTSVISLFTFLGSWLAFGKGLPAVTPYYVTIAIFCIIAVIRLIFTKKYCGFSIIPFVKKVALPVTFATIISVTITFFADCFILGDGTAASIGCIVIASLSVCAATYATALTKGEKIYFAGIIKRVFCKK